MPASMTRAEFARHLNVNRSHVTRLAQAGRLVEDKRGRVLVEASLDRIRETEDPNRDDVRARHAAGRAARDEPGTETDENGAGGNGKDDPGDERAGRSFAKARAEKEHYLALTARREYEVLAGSLVDADDVRKAAADAGAMLRSLLENWPDQMAPVLAPVTDVDELRRLLDDAVETLLRQLADAMVAELIKP